jgi:hypothetical protein
MLATIAVLSAPGCVEMNSIDGSGNVITETRPVTGFSAISLAGSGNVIIKQDGTESLTITADDNILPYLTSQIGSGQLSLSVKKDVNIKPTADIVYRITVKSIKQIDLAGAGTIDARPIKGEQLKVSISGSGQATVAGNVGQEEIVISGSGDYDGDSLLAKTASVRISGSGNVVLAVSDKLDVKVNGSGSVKYSGDPVVTSKFNGSGSVEKQ